MPPAAKKRATRATTRQPLATTTPPCEQKQVMPNLIEIFNSSQHVTTSNAALNQLKKLYKNTEFRQFEEPFRNCIKKLLQSKQTIYFKTSCDFVCKFLQYLSKLSDETKAKERSALENTAPGLQDRRTTRSSLPHDASRSRVATVAQPKRGRQAASKRGNKRKAADSSEDELVGDFLSNTAANVTTDSTTDDDSLILETTVRRRKSAAPSLAECPTITDHDRLVCACIDVADNYMRVANAECRHNAVYFVCKFLAHVESLDEEICDALRSILPERVRDRKPIIRAQAVLASRTFQDNKTIQLGFLHHFYHDPELVVRKALLQIMNTDKFGYDFLIDSTQDGHEVMRKAAFQRLGKISPLDFKDSKQLHRVIHNGLNERERQASYSFKTHTLEPWLAVLYDGLDLYKLLEHFDVLNNHEDVCRLIELICEQNLDEIQNNGTTTKLHHVVESFRERWLNADNLCLPTTSQIDEKLVVIWLTLVKFCKANHGVIKAVKVRAVQPQASNPNESLERILDSQEKNDELAELYERLTPDLVNLVDFLRRFIQHADQSLRKREANPVSSEFIYHQIMQFISSYEIGDELERKTTQEVMGLILKENLLTDKYINFIPPIINCLSTLVYPSSSNLMINYTAELIHNVRSHLDDLMVASAQPQFATPLKPSAMAAPSKTPKSAKNFRIDTQPATRFSYVPEMGQHQMEDRIANIIVEIHELTDKLDACIKDRDYDQAKVIDNKRSDLNAELARLREHRWSIASDMSHMTMVVETEPCGSAKLSSTMIGDTSMEDSNSSTQQSKEDVRIFKHHKSELIKCLQMYYGCLQSVRISEVPQTMLNHLEFLSVEALDDWFKNETRVRELMVACNGITALVDKNFAKGNLPMTIFISACHDHNGSIEIRTTGFKSLVDVICQHEDLEISDLIMDKLEEFLNSSLREYGKYDPNNIQKNELEFVTAIVEGTTKLFYFKKLSSPEIMSHLILWWYHPRTHSKMKQFIGIFLPTFVNDLSKKQSSRDEGSWLGDLLEDTFVISIEYLYDYIFGRKADTMNESDMNSLIDFLCNLVPLAFHPGVMDKLDKRMDDLPESSTGLLKYFKRSKNSLTALAPQSEEPLARPLQFSIAE